MINNTGSHQIHTLNINYYYLEHNPLTSPVCSKLLRFSEEMRGIEDSEKLDDLAESEEYLFKSELNFFANQFDLLEG